jgi:hypothetical protein
MPSSKADGEMKISVNGRETKVTSISDLRRALIRPTSEKFREIWLNVKGGPALCALLNGDVGWLMFLRHSDGDAGFSSRNLAFKGSTKEMIEYRLSNGQIDKYPAGWALPEGEVTRVLEYFAQHRSRAPFVEWHDDSR